MYYKKIIIIILAVALLFGISFGIVQLVQKNNNQTNQSLTDEQKFKAEMNAILENAQLTDSDLDGLSNDEEKTLGTNPNKSDSDSDGLLDKDEINIYKTNPLKADTDGDGKKDGYEVDRGTNPLVI
ncbi:MAG: S-layer domain-containing protein [Candidatus Magasanikbacteria bacterium GW2011_GWA2_37_8]|uniref:S-layer domain-containing protein n=1 Tax=Candidatus Magasanikbacteria bacterium GW2011_GWA2_37_8 TaxID=1619036 RepID=A0A0G0H827_9BACT|nr:MAG: S-layer domain-containing protein [Candidatus Magasanikbacteria bacterium GW2011_GWA2_37_8]